MSTDQTPALARATEALNRAQEVDGPEDMTLAEKAARIAVSAALHARPGEPDSVASAVRVHRVECTGLEGVTCHACRDLGWMTVTDYSRHVADAVRAAVLGADQ